MLNQNITDKYRIMVFDLNVEGHHASYIQHLITYWGQKELPGHLDIVVSPLFINQHPNVVNAVLNFSQHSVRLVSIDPDEYAKLENLQRFVILRYFKEWHLFCQYARKLRADHGLIMYFDFFQLPSVLGGNPPCPFSGIYFRPTFHYNSFSNNSPTLTDRIQALRKKLLLACVLRNPSLKALFCLDPFAAKYIEQIFRTKAKIVHLPDPVRVDNKASSRAKQLRASLEIETDRYVFLLFGLLSRRKGLYQLLEAISLLPPSVCKKLCVLLAGVIAPSEEASIESQINELRQSLPVQIISLNQFVPEQDVQAYFHLAEVVLAPYQHHMGMSGILMQAAAAQKPVLASKYGVMGEIVRRYHLGVTIDSSVPYEIAQRICAFLEKRVGTMFDPEQALKFAEENSPEKFSRTLFEYTFGHGSSLSKKHLDK